MRFILSAQNDLIPLGYYVRYNIAAGKEFITVVLPPRCWSKTRGEMRVPKADLDNNTTYGNVAGAIARIEELSLLYFDLVSGE